MPGSYATTARYALRWLLGSSLVSDIDEGFQSLAEDIDALMVGYSEGLLSARPASGTHGRMYRATDTGQTFMDVGTRWVEPGVALGEVKWLSADPGLSGYLEANGQGVTSTNADLRALYVAQGNPHGVDVNGDPKVPDLQDHAAVGSSSTHALGAAFGEATHLLTASESGLPSHPHSFTTGLAGQHAHNLTTAAAAVVLAGNSFPASIGGTWQRIQSGSGGVGPLFIPATGDSPMQGSTGGHSHTGATDATPSHFHTGQVDNNAAASAAVAHNNEGRRVALKAYVKA